MTELALSGKYGTGKSVVIDDDDLPKVLAVSTKWHLTKNGYAVVNKGQKTVFLHSIILPTGDLDCDHEHRNKLDCRKAELRKATRAQNARNTAGKQKRLSKFKGVTFAKDTGEWRAYINLGRFKSEEEAARAYDAAIKLLFPDYGYRNFPDK